MGLEWEGEDVFIFIKGSFFLCFDVLFWILFCGIFFLIIRVLIGLYQRFGSILTISSYTPYVVLVIHVRWINSGLSFFFFFVTISGSHSAASVLFITFSILCIS